MATWRAGRPAGPFSVLGLAVAAAVVILDQIAKAWAEGNLGLAEPVDVLPILTLYRVNNTGIAFSFLAGSGPGLIVLTAAITLMVGAIWWRARSGGWLATVGFALIVGGALGNLIDRIRLGYVIDYLLLHLGDRPLFVFNLADAALTLGPTVLLVVYLFPGEEPPPDAS